ncbi:MAG: hypothetical protein AB1593_04310 [Pseudomonadota bacterium]
MELRYGYLRLVRDATNLSWLKTRGFDGYLVSMNQSGTHWLFNMLTLAMAKHYQLEVPRHIQNCHIIGSPKQPTGYAGIPSLARNHQIPNPLFTGRMAQWLLCTPGHVLLVRDLRVVLASHYKGFEATYRVDFSDYLRGRLDKMRAAGGPHKFDKDIWWGMRFLNSWGRVRRARPDAVRLVR